MIPVIGNAGPLFENSPFRSILCDADNNQTDDTPCQENSVLLVDNGYDALLLRIHLIRNATRSIDIQTFIWSNDECGRLIMYELIQAAKRGVRIRILADNFGSEQDPKISAFLATAHENLEIKLYRPVADRIKPPPIQTALKAVFRFKDLNQRMHNKLMIFDDAIILTGGRNIEKTYYNHATGMNFKDLDAVATGPVVSEACRSFEKYWAYRHSVSCRELIDVANAIAQKDYPEPATRADFAFNGFFEELDKEADTERIIQERFISKAVPVDQIEFVSDAPGKNSSFWLWGEGKATKKIKGVAKKAREQVLIQSPYLVLSTSAQKVFKHLLKNYPDIRVIVSTNSCGSADKALAYSANYRLRPVYIQDLDFSIYEYKPIPSNILEVFPSYTLFAARAQANNEAPPFLCIHSKVMVVDSRISFVGSYNMDPRSGNLNTECGLLIEDASFSRMLEKQILKDCIPGNSWVIAKKKMPLQLDELNAITEGLSGLSPIDIWPIRNTSGFELIPGKTALPPDDPDFYSHYRDIGSFPGIKDDTDLKQVMTVFYKTVGGIATPLF
jgi:phosphatidylserine/phosphatidylglycerophosphate/cardiolipin synthase-like enzyme